MTGKLRAGVIAAGAGERLQAAGPLKPLVAVGDRPLIDHVLGSIARAGAESVVIIINDHSAPVREHVAAATWPFEIRWLVQSTPSSMHSFLLVLEALAADGPDPVLISTVDTVARPATFARFVAAAAGGDADLTLALTSLIDDEKPLLVRLDDAQTARAGGARRALAIGSAAAGSHLATAGYYFVSPRVLAEAEAARRENLSALRAFLGRLLERGYRVDGVVMPESIDVDRPEDVVAGEEFLR